MAIYPLCFYHQLSCADGGSMTEWLFAYLTVCMEFSYEMQQFNFGYTHQNYFLKSLDLKVQTLLLQLQLTWAEVVSSAHK